LTELDSIAAPLLVGRVFGDPGLVLDLVARHGPYWNQTRYLPPTRRAAAATTPAGHPWAMEGGSPPLFRGDWHDRLTTLDGVRCWPARSCGRRPSGYSGAPNPFPRTYS